MKHPKIKLILFDFNGVVILGDHKSTAKHFGRIHHTPWKKVYDILYTKYFNMIAENKISEVEGWQRPIKELGWKQDWRAMRQWHLDQQQFNPPAINMVKQLRLEGYPCVILSKNLIQWFEYKEDRLHFRMHFDNAVNTQELRLPKASKETMEWICARFDVRPDEILFIEDQEQNLIVPKKMGVHCIFYKTFQQCEREVIRILGKKWRRPHHEWQELSQRQRMSPLPNVFSLQAVTTITADIAKHYFPLTAMLEKRMLWFFADKEHAYLAAQNILGQILDDPKFFLHIIARVRKQGTKLVAFAQHTARKNLRNMSPTALALLYQKYADLYRSMYGPYFTILTVEKQLYSYLKGLLFLKVSSSEQRQRYFTMLTTNTRAMYPKEEEKGLYTLAAYVQSSSSLRELLKKQPEEIEKLLGRYPGFARKFRAHCKKFFWITRDYEDPVWEPKDFILRLQGILKRGNIQANIQRIERFHADAVERVSLAERACHLRPIERKIFAAMRDGIYLKEFRKRFVSLSLYHFDTVLFEYSRRLAIPLIHLRQCLREEPYQALVKGRDYSHILRERYNLALYTATHGKITVTTGKKAQHIKKNLLQIPSTWKILHGTPVSEGRAKGPAKLVINLDELSKVKPGDIIVTVQAVPSFSTAIQKSAGLVADGGTGVTSHPATLAREAGIPCVTGLRISTLLIKDGDIIEVDGYHGTVKKLR